MLLYDSGDFDAAGEPGRLRAARPPADRHRQEGAPVRAWQERRRGRRDLGAVRARSGVHPEAASPAVRPQGRGRSSNKNYQALDAGIGYVERNIPERGTLQVKAGDPRRDVADRRLGQPGDRDGRAGGRLPGLRRLPDHPGHGHHGVPGLGAAEGRRLGRPGRGRDVGAGHGDRRLLRRQEVDDGDLRPGHQPDGRADGPRRRWPRSRSWSSMRSGPAPRRACRPARSRATCSWRRWAATARSSGSCWRRSRSRTASPRRSTPSTWPSSSRCRSLLMGDTTLGVRTESIPTPDLSKFEIVNRLGINGHGANGQRPTASGRASRAATSGTSSPSPASRRWRSRARTAASTSPPAWSTTSPAGRARTRTTTGR